MIDRSRERGALAQGRRLLKAAEPLIEILSLPLKLAEGRERAVVLYFDELQRVVDYDGGEEVLGLLVDIYSGRTDVVCLVDGSDRRAFEGMMGPPVGFGKLIDSFPLARKIPAARWREGLPERFAEAGLEIEGECLDELIEFGAERPYATMLIARKIGTDTVGPFELREGIAEAERNLVEDADG